MKKGGHLSTEEFLDRKICDLREEFGIQILTPENLKKITLVRISLDLIL